MSCAIMQGFLYADYFTVTKHHKYESHPLTLHLIFRFLLYADLCIMFTSTLLRIMNKQSATLRGGVHLVDY